jgi:hypothetical protein
MNVPHHDKLARFIFSKSHFAKEKNIVKYGAFIPDPDRDDLSVFRISGLSRSEVWSIGRKHVQGTRNLKARGDLFAEVVFANNLEVVADEQGHPLHASITPYPADKRSRIRIAMELALASELVLMPTE